jgi:hypothetical protein
MADPDTLQIPSTRALLTSLIATLATSTSHAHGSSNPLSDASENTKATLLTLHTLFPTDLLPALDLLDRGLVTRFVLASASDTEQQAINPKEPDQNQSQNQDSHHRNRKQTLSYYVRTSQQAKHSSRFSRSHHATTAAATVQGTTSYEVHLTAWNCSCPAFAFAAFPADLASEDSNGSEGTGDDGTFGENWHWEDGWRFGGLTRGDRVPACKHLLACVIAEHCGGFEGLVEEREVGVGEVAGWAAGWGD